MTDCSIDDTFHSHTNKKEVSYLKNESNRAKKEELRLRYRRAIQLFDEKTAKEMLFDYVLEKKIFEENVKFAAELESNKAACKHYH